VNLHIPLLCVRLEGGWRIHPNESVLGLELLRRVQAVVHEAKPGGLAATKLQETFTASPPALFCVQGPTPNTVEDLTSMHCFPSLSSALSWPTHCRYGLQSREPSSPPTRPCSVPRPLLGPVLFAHSPSSNLIPYFSLRSFRAPLVASNRPSTASYTTQADNLRLQSTLKPVFGPNSI